MKRKGFTLVELLVVIAIIALLMGILMPALARVRQLAFRMVCGTNLSGIGKAMLIYANDYEDELPRAGGRTSTWGATKDWTAADRRLAFGLNLTIARLGSFTAENSPTWAKDAFASWQKPLLIAVTYRYLPVFPQEKELNYVQPASETK